MKIGWEEIRVSSYPIFSSPNVTQQLRSKQELNASYFPNAPTDSALHGLTNAKQVDWFAPKTILINQPAFFLSQPGHRQALFPFFDLYY
ncbi:hypothetical protein H5993_06090 [Lactobacillus alvi]|uniref:Uncharacterized protein n=1 Tax=Limosilactobacillus alvi TaxID=990412 RepID=A0ABS2EP95_9LACO|nr:hypothetical protein [Limosilactobacillus alvi]